MLAIAWKGGWIPINFNKSFVFHIVMLLYSEHSLADLNNSLYTTGAYLLLCLSQFNL